MTCAASGNHDSMRSLNFSSRCRRRKNGPNRTRCEKRRKPRSQAHVQRTAGKSLPRVDGSDASESVVPAGRLRSGADDDRSARGRHVSMGSDTESRRRAVLECRHVPRDRRAEETGLHLALVQRARLAGNGRHCRVPRTWSGDRARAASRPVPDSGDAQSSRAGLDALPRSTRRIHQQGDETMKRILITLSLLALTLTVYADDMHHMANAPSSPAFEKMKAL